MNPAEPSAASCVDKARAALSRWSLAPPLNRPLLVALSGGPDSVGLFHVLHELGVPVLAAHLDHETRNGASAQDAAFAEALAQKAGVPFYLRRRPVAEEAAAAGASFEAAARAARYAFLAGVARETGAIAIATGHHAGDRAETVLWRVIRGCGPGGLAGARGETRINGVRVIRPLIHCDRGEIMAYLQARQLEFRRDHSNSDIKHLRNAIRHDLLPRLRQAYNPGVDAALLRHAAIAEEEDNFLAAQTAAFLERCAAGDGLWDRRAFARGHAALQRRAVAAWMHRRGGDAGFEAVEEARRFVTEGRSGQSLTLGDGVLLHNTARFTEWRAEHASPPPADPAPLAVPGEARIAGLRLRAARLETPPADPRAFCSVRRQVFDSAALGAHLSVRVWRPGDRFQPLGMTGSKKIKDYLSSLGAPWSERERQLAVLAEDGRIAWLVGRAPAQPFAVTAQTREAMVIEVDDGIE